MKSIKQCFIAIGTGVLGHLNFSLTFRGAVGSTGGFLEAGLVVGVGGRGEGGIGAGKEAQGIVGWGLF